MTETLGTSHGLQEKLLSAFLYLGTDWVLYLLIVLSVLSITVAVERWFYFARHKDNLDTLREGLSERLNRPGAGVADARQFLVQHRSPAAAICLAGLDALPQGAASVEEIIAGATQVERLRMERGLAFLGTLGNNAPFIGLFGTVLGIIRAFRDLSLNAIEGSEAVMAGIAEALVATAVGLLVALPAVAVFNGFQRLIRTRLIASEAVTRVVLAYAKTERR